MEEEASSGHVFDAKWIIVFYSKVTKKLPTLLLGLLYAIFRNSKIKNLK